MWIHAKKAFFSACLALLFAKPASAIDLSTAPASKGAESKDVIGQIVTEKEQQEEARKKAAAQQRVQKALTSKTGSTKDPFQEDEVPEKNPRKKSTTITTTTVKTPNIPAAIALPAVPAYAPARPEPEDVIGKIIEGQLALDKTKNMNDRCCELKNVYQRDVDSSADRALGIKAKFDAAAARDQGKLQEPNSGENTFGSRSYMCGTRAGNYDVCIFEGDVTAGKFRFANKGPNKIIGASSEGRMRDWMFNFEGRNRQDISFTVSDSVDGRESHSRESHMMIFPRKYLPSIRVEGQKQIVTLPTGETVTYDATTKVITGGALSEKPLGQGPESVTYSGSGLFLRIDGKQDPRHSRQGSMAVISKGGKTCRVPAKSLWPDQSDSSALHFKFATDSGFNEFLKATPGCPTLD